MSTSTRQGIGSIRADELLPIAEVQTRLGIGKAAMRTMRKNGLAIRRVGRQSYVVGSDLIDFARKRGRIVR